MPASGRRKFTEHISTADEKVQCVEFGLTDYFYIVEAEDTIHKHNNKSVFSKRKKKSHLVFLLPLRMVLMNISKQTFTGIVVSCHFTPLNLRNPGVLSFQVYVCH